MGIRVYELLVKVYLLKDIPSSESNNNLSALIDKCLIKDGHFLEMHTQNKFKGYCFNNLFPMSEDYIYKKGNIYSFKIRSLDKKFVNYIVKTLSNEYNMEMKVLSVEPKVVPKKHIDKITTITPVVLTFDCGYWRANHTIEDFEERVVNNLKKKYKQYTGIDLPEEIDLFTSLKFKNKKSIPTKYKNVCLLGDKIELKISNNKIAQELAYMSLAASIGEKGSRGFGFANYLWTPCMGLRGKGNVKGDYGSF